MLRLALNDNYAFCFQRFLRFQTKLLQPPLGLRSNLTKLRLVVLVRIYIILFSNNVGEGTRTLKVSHMNLNHARLPISPLRHTVTINFSKIMSKLVFYIRFVSFHSNSTSPLRNVTFSHISCGVLLRHTVTINFSKIMSKLVFYIRFVSFHSNSTSPLRNVTFSHISCGVLLRHTVTINFSLYYNPKFNISPLLKV